jgi:O-antigen/teichoic acid export membrane protein
VARFAVAEIVLALAYSAATWLLSSSLLHLLYAGKYDNYAPYLAPLSLLLLGEAMGGVAASALQALELPSKVFTASLGGALLTLLGTACLHPLTMPAAVRLIVAVYISTATLLALSLYQTLGDRRLVRFEIEEGPWV